ncbi:MAG TPA: hypothetical protein VH722_06065, partial [Alphaproteobacteria bacterium]|nr:hypothetical protein [Alphaproteobacteria bacterium]
EASYKAQRYFLKMVNSPDLDKIPDEGLWHAYREMLVKISVINLIDFSVLHEFGHIVHRDSMEIQDGCRMWKQELSADRFASDVLVKLKASDESHPFESTLGIWNIYATRLVTLSVGDLKDTRDDKLDGPSKFDLVRTVDGLIHTSSMASSSASLVPLGPFGPRMSDFAQEIKKQFSPAGLSSVIAAESCHDDVQ